ncbi:aquaporin-like protein [Thermothelomyces thermophilus ATCC 42464]|uniref:Aquaporin-like protein n=1 Tax=Thermothelomyces thermophilus (strain ATCC 42464 / BCRC 31852 / DSM 1799) TaxID=573729 RepID=G2QMR3_THET4|nr:aquaporin-like protein [Thermothelomyces thermophilus ATCC 42464]AEO61243.1 aquaporin-like protein [Thermothelomyces thermophilus ATCC 42464]
MNSSRRLRLFSFASDTANQNESSGRLPMLTRPLTARNNIVAALGEFVGTFLFLFFSFAGTQIANTPPPTPPAGSDTPLPNTSNLMFIALAFGLSLMANVWAFYRVTGGLFNPVVTEEEEEENKTFTLWLKQGVVKVALALFLVGGLSGIRVLVVVIAQFIGGIAAAAVVSALFPGPMMVATTLGGGASISQGLFIEMFLTAQLVFVIIMLAAEKHKSTFLAPIGIGIAFFLAELIGVYFTGGSLNPARSLGPAVVNHSFPGYFWIYWVGPLLGSLLACAFYVLLKYLRWKECNPSQDWNEIEKQESERQLRNKASKNITERPSTSPTDATHAADVQPQVQPQSNLD